MLAIDPLGLVHHSGLIPCIVRAVVVRLVEGGRRREEIITIVVVMQRG